MSAERRRRKIGPFQPTDIELFEAFALLIVFMYFALNSIQAQAQFNRYIFYSLLLLASLGILKGMQARYGEPRDEGIQYGRVLDWNENFKQSHLAFVLFGVGLIVVLSALITSGSVANILGASQLAWAPTILGFSSTLPSTYPLAWLPESFSNLIQQSLWQVFVVAFAEETMKLAVILTFARRTGNEWFAVILAVGAWAEGHAMLAYGGAVLPLLAAFAAGIVLYVVLRMTKSLVVPILIHGTVNMIAILPSFGFALTGALALLPFFS